MVLLLSMFGSVGVAKPTLGILFVRANTTAVINVEAGDVPNGTLIADTERCAAGVSADIKVSMEVNAMNNSIGKRGKVGPSLSGVLVNLPHRTPECFNRLLKCAHNTR